MEKKPLVILTGPTAVGKTELSILLAKSIGGEIISADSMQVYKHMDIGSAKITREEMQGVPHHLIDIIEPTEEFNIVLFKQYVMQALEEIYSKGHIPILTGGTGFYIQAILYDVDFTKCEEDTSFRKQMEEIGRSEEGKHLLWERLLQVDEASALLIHENNVKRVIRALEFYEKTGRKISEHNEQQRARSSPYDFCYFVLNDDRLLLYDKIDKRVDQMFEKGLVQEVKNLRTMGLKKDMVSMQGLGYKEVLSYFDNEISLERAIYLVKRDTRHFAKRQLTWFRREEDVIWIDKSEFSYSNQAILEYIIQKLKENRILNENRSVL